MKPKRLCSLVRDCLANDPEQRPKISRVVLLLEEELKRIKQKQQQRRREEEKEELNDAPSINFSLAFGVLFSFSFL